MPKVRRSPKGEAARRRIVDAAVEVYAELGFHGGSYRKIAEAAGIPSATVAHHFPSKRRLYGAVLERIADDLNGRIAPVFDDTDASFPERLDRFADSYVDWGLVHPEYTQILLRELVDNPVRLTAGDVTFRLDSPMNHMFAFVRAGQAAGAFNDTDPLYFIVQFVGAVSFFFAATPSFERLLDDPAPLSHDRFRESMRLAAQRILLT